MGGRRNACVFQSTNNKQEDVDMARKGKPSRETGLFK